MNTHKVYTREQLKAMTADQLDTIYTELVGYPVIAESEGLETKESAIDLILGQYNEIEKHKPASVSAHTPGPWSKPSNPKTPQHIIIFEGPNGYVPVCYLHIHNDSKTTEANARLISLAPEMLEALQQIAATVDGLDMSAELWENIHSLLSRARQ